MDIEKEFLELKEAINPGLTGRDQLLTMRMCFYGALHSFLYSMAALQDDQEAFESMVQQVMIDLKAFYNEVKKGA